MARKSVTAKTPTGGSAGALPGVLVTLIEERGLGSEAAALAFLAAGVAPGLLAASQEIALGLAQLVGVLEQFLGYVGRGGIGDGLDQHDVEVASPGMEPAPAAVAQQQHVVFFRHGVRLVRQERSSTAAAVAQVRTCPRPVKIHL
jgi:hypothetical protein